MFSVVCVYNNHEVLQSRLLDSLSKQNVEHEVIVVDNSDNRFTNAASALNHGAKQAHGDFLLFAHQDIAFLSTDWLSKAESILKRYKVKGWTGVAGVDANGKNKGFVIDRNWLFGDALHDLEEVQTLDECVLIHARNAQNEYFDENVPTWHAYGIEACCAEMVAGEKNYVLSLPTWHDSKTANLKGLEESHRYVWEKYKSFLPHIHTTCGILPDSYGWQSSLKNKLSSKQRLKRLIAKKYTKLALLYKGLETLTNDETSISCLHYKNIELEPLKASAFFHLSKQEKHIVHHFRGLEVSGLQNQCVVVMPELTAQLLQKWSSLETTLKSVKTLILCLNVIELIKHPLVAYKLKQTSHKSRVCRKEGFSTVAVFRFDN